MRVYAWKTVKNVPWRPITVSLGSDNTAECFCFNALGDRIAFPENIMIHLGSLGISMVSCQRLRHSDPV